MRTVLQGGTVVRPDGVFAADLAFEDGRITEMAEHLPVDNATVVDAAGCYVLPGAVDAQVCCAPEGLEETGRAAAFGGTTCLGWVSRQEAQAPAGSTPAVDMVRLPAACGTEDRPLPVGCHAVISLDPGCGMFPGRAAALLRDAAREEATVLLRPEMPSVTQMLECALRESGQTRVPSWPLAHPAYAEEEAVRLGLTLARAAGCRMVVAPLASRGGLESLEAARARGQDAEGATCPQYLLLDESAYEEGAAEGLKYVMRPPLRPAGEARHLWEALARGSLAWVASDHHDCTFERKWAEGSACAFDCPSGAPGVETRLPLLFSEGVLKGRLPLPRFVECLSTAPARFLGLDRCKGNVAPGFDADICLLDPREERLLTARRLHQGDYTPFEGTSVRGWPRAVWLRGRPLVENGRWLPREGEATGHWLSGRGTA